MSDPCAFCHRPIPEGHRMVAFGLVVHASVLQCGGGRPVVGHIDSDQELYEPGGPARLREVQGE